jgi:hypothetical protein
VYVTPPGKKVRLSSLRSVKNNEESKFSGPGFIGSRVVIKGLLKSDKKEL